MLKSKILVAGCAGFIGSNLVDTLLSKNLSVVGIDNLDEYYKSSIKKDNLKSALKSKAFKFYQADLLDLSDIKRIFQEEKPSFVVHLAARPGVRPSLNDPLFYAKNNVMGTVNLLKLSVDFKVQKFIFGSSSSVYGQGTKLPFLEDAQTDSILSPYGASKKSAEFFIETFYYSYGLNSIIFRFFTVYGKRGRPDMAPALFAKAITSGLEIKQFGNGESSRDYTYIEDVVEAIIGGLEKKTGFEIINLGGNKPVYLKEFISQIETLSGKKAKIKKLPRQTGDVENTWASIEKAKKILGWQPKTEIAEGLKIYLEWLKKN